MLDNGYSLARVELLNWGNFHGYQKFDLAGDRSQGPLFAPPPASAVLGINGSGKSTLIDALMIAMLPFENSVKLGVTNDLESGSAGGRTIRDYVLGKHSSTSGVNMAGAMGRKDGCSIVLLVFKHNRLSDRNISFGRVWWYQNYNVSSTQPAFLAYSDISIAHLCPNGQTPRSSKSFRNHVKDHLPGLQIFETMQAYFTAISSSLGQISRDDLKILNRAFYVKSISQIDQFIRENMLLESENPHLDRLLENVRNGQEIALAIEVCEAKIAAISRILKDVNRLKDFANQRAQLDGKLRLVSVLKEWMDINHAREEVEQLRLEISARERALPELRSQLATRESRHTAIQFQLAHNDLNARLNSIDTQIGFLSERIDQASRRWSLIESSARDLNIKLPRKDHDWPAYREELAAKILEHEERARAKEEELEKSREAKFALDEESKKLREELNHFSQFKTLIPRDLYSIKEDALRELHLPSNHIYFVGELVQVKPEYKEYRRAIESSLFPISRNLLCHPDHLQDFTKWLDARGLRSDLVAKRIRSAELQTETEPQVNKSRDGYWILDMIDILSQTNHPFYSYLEQWFSDAFDFRVVDLKEFRKEDGKVVTREGLVKTDARTMRKLKQNFVFSLGWDNQEILAEISANLLRLNEKHSSLSREMTSLQSSIRQNFDQARFLHELRTSSLEVDSLRLDENRLKELHKERDKLYRDNPDYEQLQREVTELAESIKTLRKKESTLEAEIDTKNKRSQMIASLIPAREADLKGSLHYSRLCQEHGDDNGVTKALEELSFELQNKGLSRLQFEANVNEEIRGVENRAERSRSAASALLMNFRRDFNDPNLPYELPLSFAIESFAREWIEAEARLQRTELPQAQERWGKFFDQVLMDSVKDMVNEIKSKIHEIERTIRSINEVLKLTNFEDLADEKRYLQIHFQTASDERVRRFRKTIVEIEKILGPGIRAQAEGQSQIVMEVLIPFVEEFQKEVAYRNFVTDVRNHFHFEVHSLRRSMDNSPDEIKEIFTGSRRDAKSSAQTTQLAYTLLASCLAYRFRFHDPVGGQETPRLLVLDEFGGKFDNEKPREVMKLLEKMGFQSILVSPMSKADLLAEGIGQLVLGRFLNLANRV